MTAPTTARPLGPTIAADRLSAPTGDAIRDRLAEAMLVVAGRHGYPQSSIELVLRASGSSRGAFYHRFDNKLDCFLQAYDVGVARIEARLLAAAQPAGPWSSTVRRAVVELARFVEQHPEVSRALLVEVHAAGPEAQAKKLAATRRAARALRSGFDDRYDRDRGRTAKPDQEFVAVGVVGAILMGLQTRLERNAHAELRELAPELVHFAVAPYLGARAADQEMRWAMRDCAAVSIADDGFSRETPAALRSRA